MNADCQDFKHKELTEKIISIFYQVYNKLDYGFMEKIYEKAMMIEFRKKKDFCCCASSHQSVL
jgi:GxxExxY protein